VNFAAPGATIVARRALHALRNESDKKAFEATDLLNNSGMSAANRTSGLLPDVAAFESEFYGGTLADRLDALASSTAGRASGPDIPDLLFNSGIAQSDGSVLVSMDAGMHTRNAWAAARARHHPNGRAQRGEAEGTARALAAAQSLTLVCARVDCNALVHLPAARRQAIKEGRDEFEPGDGCGSKTCSRGNFRPGQFKRNQYRMAAALELPSGPKRRHLVKWPESLAAREVLVQTARAAVSVATATRAAMAPLASSLSSP
jgi:hypothetical protein